VATSQLSAVLVPRESAVGISEWMGVLLQLLEEL